MKKKIVIKKKDGTEELFDKEKLVASLRRSGADPALTKEVVDYVVEELKDGVTTDWIYSHAFALLKKKADKPTTYRYSLRRAVGQMGPSGFPFEVFVATVFDAYGYKTRVGQKIKGKCVTHEVDVVAEDENDIITAELKFHNKLFMKTDIKVAMYVDSRFRDIAAGGFYKNKKARPFLITNTKFSSSAISYAECGGGLELMSWNYPRKGFGNLHDLIQKAQIHPVTALTTFSKKDQKNLLAAGFVSCRDLKQNNGEDLRQSGILSKEKIKKVHEEIDRICNVPIPKDVHI